MAGYKATGKMHPLLQTPPPSGIVSHVFEWFRDLNSARTSNGFGYNPLSYSEIMAWCRLSGTHLTTFELSLIKDLDNAYMAARAEARAEEGKTE